MLTPAAQFHSSRWALPLPTGHVGFEGIWEAWANLLRRRLALKPVTAKRKFPTEAQDQRVKA